MIKEPNLDNPSIRVQETRARCSYVIAKPQHWRISPGAKQMQLIFRCTSYYTGGYGLSMDGDIGEGQG